jgi:hypothetical protein
MKNPALQHQNRLREAADLVAMKSCSLRGAFQRLGKAELAWREARDEVPTADAELTAAIRALVSLARASEIDEDGRAVPQSGGANADNPV